MTHSDAICRAIAAGLIEIPRPDAPPCRVCDAPATGHLYQDGSALCPACTIDAWRRGEIMPRQETTNDAL